MLKRVFILLCMGSSLVSVWSLRSDVFKEKNKSNYDETFFTDASNDFSSEMYEAIVTNARHKKVASKNSTEIVTNDIALSNQKAMRSSLSTPTESTIGIGVKSANVETRKQNDSPSSVYKNTVPVTFRNKNVTFSNTDDFESDAEQYRSCLDDKSTASVGHYIPSLTSMQRKHKEVEDEVFRATHPYNPVLSDGELFVGDFATSGFSSEGVPFRPLEHIDQAAVSNNKNTMQLHSSEPTESKRFTIITSSMAKKRMQTRRPSSVVKKDRKHGERRISQSALKLKNEMQLSSLELTYSSHEFQCSHVHEPSDSLSNMWKSFAGTNKLNSQSQKHLKEEQIQSCHHCGELNKHVAKFCNECGSPLSKPPTLQTTGIGDLPPHKSGLHLDSDGVIYFSSDVPGDGRSSLVNTGVRVGKYSIEQVLGEGGFGKVHQVSLVSEPSGRRYAMKEMKNMKESYRKALEKERNLLQKLKHENIVQYIDAFEENDVFYIVLELANSGDLAHHIQQQTDLKKQWSKWIISDCFNQVVCGLNYLHTYRSGDVNGIIHRDLKPQNILVCDSHNSKTLSFKIADFGLARVMGASKASVDTFAGTRVYMSPEALNEESYSFATDVWALGCVLYELCTLKIAFRRPADVLQLKLGIENLPVAIPTISNSSAPNWEHWKELSNICSSILDRDPQQRPSCRMLLRRMAELKLPAWVNINQLSLKDGTGNTPLMRAITDKDLRTVQALMDFQFRHSWVFIGINEPNNTMWKNNRRQYPLKVVQLATGLIDTDPCVDRIRPGCSVKMRKVNGFASARYWMSSLEGLTGEVISKTDTEHVWCIKFYSADLRARGIEPGNVTEQRLSMDSIGNGNYNAKALAVVIGMHWNDASRIVVKNRTGRADLITLDRSVWLVIFSFLIIPNISSGEAELNALILAEQEAVAKKNYLKANEIAKKFESLTVSRNPENEDAVKHLEDSCTHFDILESEMELVPVRNQRMAIVQAILEHPVLKVNFQGDKKNDWTLLHVAVYKNDVDVLKFLLTNPDINVNVQNKAGHTPLHEAVMQNHIDSVKLLLAQADINLNLQRRDGCTAFHVAVKYNLMEVTKLLLTRNIYVNFRNNCGHGALHIAVRNGSLRMVKFLLANSNIDVNLRDIFGDTALHDAARKYSAHWIPKDFARCRIHIDKFANPILAKKDIDDQQFNIDRALQAHLQNGDSSPAMIDATRRDINVDIVELLLAHADITPNLANRYGNTALEVAKKWKSSEIVELLEERTLPESDICVLS